MEKLPKLREDIYLLTEYGDKRMILSEKHCSYLPVLMSLFSKTSGEVIEIGTGVWSTPFLHWACFPTKRHFISYEDNPVYARAASQYVDDFHDVYLVNSYDEIVVDRELDIVFIDSFPVSNRKLLPEKFVNNAKYVIIHDSHLEDYSGICKYFFNYSECLANTAILSNFIDINNLKI